MVKKDTGDYPFALILNQSTERLNIGQQLRVLN